MNGNPTTHPGQSVVMIGATGAVGSQAARTLTGMPDVAAMTLLGRRPLEGLPPGKVTQITIDIFDPTSFQDALKGHHAAICTLGVGEPSKMPKEDFEKIDKDAVLAFAIACKAAGVRHFQLLGSVGADPGSRVFYLRIKGELEDELRALDFERLSVFRPSMILTPTNRYGVSQALALAVWPRLQPMLVGGWRKYRGIAVDRLGKAIALNLRGPTTGTEILHWEEIDALARKEV